MFALTCPTTLALSQRLIAVATATLVATAAGPLRAQQLIAPDATIAGLSQSYLSAQWAQWVYSYTAPTNPLLDTTGAHSAAGGQGSYFFLAPAPGEDPIVRNVTVRSDQTLFFPLVGVLASLDDTYTTEAQLRAVASDVIGVASNLTVTIDSAPALMPAGFSSLLEFRQYSPLFPMNFIADNIAGVPQSVIGAVNDGYFVGLEGLAKGSHELHFTSFIQSVGDYAGFTFAQDITYHITSVPEASTWAMMSLGLLAISAGALRRRHDL